MDQDATRYRGRPGPGDVVLYGDAAPAYGKGHSSSPALFGPCLLWPNGCMDHDTTWQGGRPRPRRHCVRWGPSFPSVKGHSSRPHFSAHFSLVQSPISATAELLYKLGPIYDFLLALCSNNSEILVEDCEFFIPAHYVSPQLRKIRFSVGISLWSLVWKKNRTTRLPSDIKTFDDILSRSEMAHECHG